MAKTDYYTFRNDPQDPHHVICQAIDSDYNPTKVYHIHGATCDCWAGHKWCRHKEMLVMFKKDNLVGSNRFWNHDSKVWLPQAQGTEE